MNKEQVEDRRIAVIGGGIAGLAAAHRLIELAPTCQVTIFDPRPRLGGIISTIHEDGFQVEQSVDNFITTTPWGVALCERLGLADQLVPTNPLYRRTFVVHAGKLCRLPDGFLMMAPTQMWPLAVTPLLSPLGKLRAAFEYFIPPKPGDADESMAGFVRRRLGREVFERLVEPLVSAVYAADMEKLSVLATLPRFREMELNHGSLIRAMRHEMRHRSKTASESGARFSMFVTLREGLGSLVDAIASRLPPDAVRLNTRVAQIERIGEGWQVGIEDAATWGEGRGAKGEGREEKGDVQSPLAPCPSPLAPFPRVLPFDALILAVPSHEAARLLTPLDAELGAELASITHSGTAILSLGYDVGQIGRPIDGMGAVVPAVEKSPILALSFSSTKYQHRAPDGKILLRVFVGGARRPDLAEMPDEQLRPLVLNHLAPLLHIRGEPCYCDISHWPNTMPQYHVGHKDLIARIESRAANLPDLHLAGNAYHGVGLPDCVHGGEQAAERALYSSRSM